MRISITIVPIDKKITIPAQYNYIVQSMLLKLINEETFSKFIHDTGYKYEKRSYKLYCFSKLFGKYTYSKETRLLTFEDKVQFFISSAIPEFIEYLIKTNIFSHTEWRIWNQIVRVESIQIIEEPLIPASCQIYTLSPITVYSTFENQFGKKTYYYNPGEKDFYQLISQNILKKYTALFGKEPTDKEFNLKSVNGKYQERIIRYKDNYIIKAYHGLFKLSGNPELIKLAYQTGVSNKNSQGFGMIDIERKEAKIKC